MDTKEHLYILETQIETLEQQLKEIKDSIKANQEIDAFVAAQADMLKDFLNRFTQ